MSDKLNVFIFILVKGCFVSDFSVVLIGVLFLVEDSKDLWFGVVVVGIMFGFFILELLIM